MVRKSPLRRSAVLLLVFAMILAACWTPALAKNDKQAAASASSDPLAQFAGYDLSSKEMVSVILELDDKPVIEYESDLRAKGQTVSKATRENYEQKLKNKQNNLISELRKNGLAALSQFGYTLAFNGMAIEVPANKIAQLESIPGIKKVHPDVTVYEDLAVSVPAIGAPTAWQMPGGHDGSGVVVGVIDGWIDWSHPDLGGEYGDRVIGGWDFWLNQPIPDSGLIGVDGRHGTHVGSTVAAVAPGAKLMNYRVSSGGGGTSARLLAAMEMAIRDEVDVLTMSMGSAYGHPDAPWAKAMDNVVLAGIVFTCSNGNDGSNERTTGTYAQSELAISVGNANATVKPLIASAETGEEYISSLFSYSPELGDLLGQQLEFVYCGFGIVPEDFLDADGNSLVEGKVALVSRGGSTFRVKHDNARAAGAIAIIVHNNSADGIPNGSISYSEPNDIPTLGMTMADGLLFSTFTNKTISFSMGEYNLMSSSSSRGPDSLLNIKPDVSAPGTSIVAAVPYPIEGEDPVAGAILGENGAWYASLSGTSMATPHVAGAAAILRAAHPNWTPEQVKLALMNTALDIKQENGKSYRPIDQGSGMISIPRALNTKLFIAPGSLSFKDAQIGSLTLPVELISNNTNDATYTVTVDKYNPDNDYQIGIADTVTVRAGNTEQLAVTLQIGESLPASEPGASEYCGYIYFQNVSNPEDSYRLPYHFVYQQVISQLSVSPFYFSRNPAALQKEVTFTYTLGAPVNNLRFRVHGLSNSYFNYTGPLQPGTYSFTWDGTLVDETVVLPEGFLTIYPQYQLTEDGDWINMTNSGNTGAIAYARIIHDSTAPEFIGVRPIFGAEEGLVTITGLVDDLMFGLLDIGGEVLFNGQKLVVNSYADLDDTSTSSRGYDYGIFTSDPIEVNLRKGISFNLQGTDLAGNTTITDYHFDLVTLDNPQTERVLPGTYTISGQALQGIQVEVNGEIITLDAEGRFAVDLLIDKYGKHDIKIIGLVPGWANTKPVHYNITVICSPNDNGKDKGDDGETPGNPGNGKPKELPNKPEKVKDKE